MLSLISMETLEKLSQSTRSTSFDVEDSPRLLHDTKGAKEQLYSIDGFLIPVTQASLPGGGTIPLLKVMLNTSCERNCRYCAFRAGSNARRFSFTPDELAATFMRFHQLGIAKGLFLSTGIFNGGMRSENLLLETVEILRWKKQFRGYIHLKIMPGAEKEQVHQAMLLADRVSINLEAPSAERLQVIAPRKQFHQELFQPIQWMEEIRQTQTPEKAWNRRWPSSTTQFVVGPAGESDVELLQLSDLLFHQYRFSRTYFLAFKPVMGTPLESHPAENPIRQMRLYQAAYLLRDYGYQFEELPFLENGHLPLEGDPKRIAAQLEFGEQPISINTAPRSQLLRIPGIGPRSVERILKERRDARIGDLSNLRKMGVAIQRAAPFIHFEGTRPSYQLPFPDFPGK